VPAVRFYGIRPNHIVGGRLRLFRIAGTFRPADGTKAASTELVRFAIYADETGGEPLWEEVQAVAIDEPGRYIAFVGATSDNGIPAGPLCCRTATLAWRGVSWR
jgi:hypothetical protein